MFKVWLLVFAVAIGSALQASAQVAVDPASGLGIPWNTSLPINATNLANAMKAAAENRYLAPNGTVGELIPNNFTASLNATAANATAIVNPLGCELRVPADHEVDPFIGEWCYFNGNAGFMFRGVKSKEGKTFLQRYRLKTLKVQNATLVVNATAPIANTSIAVNATAAVRSFIEYMAIYENLAAEEEIAHLDEQYESLDDAFDHNLLLESGFSSFIEADTMLYSQLTSAQLKALRNAPAAAPLPAPPAAVLPPLPTRVFGKCAAQAAEYIDCNGGALLDLVNGTEAKGFCIDDQASAVAVLDLMDFTSKFQRFRRQLKKFAQSTALNVAPTKNSTDKFNAEEDHVRLCFLPGTFVEKARYRSKGQFETYPMGDAHGFFKPTIDIDCSSQFCKKSKIFRTRGPRNIFLNLAP